MELIVDLIMSKKIWGLKAIADLNLYKKHGCRTNCRFEFEEKLWGFYPIVDLTKKKKKKISFLILIKCRFDVCYLIVD